MKILTRLKLNPNTDSRDIPGEEGDRNADEGEVSCLRAYKMLIPCATGDEKNGCADGEVGKVCQGWKERL